MGNYTIFGGFENPRRGRQAKKFFETNAPKILDLKSSSEQIFSENCRWVPLIMIIAITIVLWHDHSQKMNIAISILNNVISIIAVFFLNC